MADHEINTFEDTPKKAEPLECPFCGEKLQDTIFKEAIITCKEEASEEEGQVFFLDNYQITKTPPQWFKDMQAKKSGGGGCMGVVLAAIGIGTMLGLALLA
ncbi:MAG: hypothetical protein GXP25_16945 [Planctomycetes bacterium]|nr:hypothetical protein [Planctomycetota bacterium]